MSDIAQQVSSEHNLEGQIKAVLERLTAHEIQCAKDQGEIKEQLARVGGCIAVQDQKIAMNTKICWTILAGVLAQAVFIIYRMGLT